MYCNWKRYATCCDFIHRRSLFSPLRFAFLRIIHFFRFSYTVLKSCASSQVLIVLGLLLQVLDLCPHQYVFYLLPSFLTKSALHLHRRDHTTYHFEARPMSILGTQCILGDFCQVSCTHFLDCEVSLSCLVSLLC